MIRRRGLSSDVSLRAVDYKWVALSNTTLGVLLATINTSIVLISLPSIFKGLHLDPLAAGNASYLLWILQGYLLVTAVLVVAFGRLGDAFGRIRIYNLGFAVFTAASLLLAIDPASGASGALWLIAFRFAQGVGAAMLLANAVAILTDVFPPHQRATALGINGIAAVAGSFLGLVLGGILSDLSWRLIFWASVPIGLLGSIWAFASLHERVSTRAARLDWIGNLTFAVGLTAVLAGLIYGIQPYGGHDMGWTSPWVLAALIGGLVVLGLFCWVEMRVSDPMFDLHLFRSPAFTFGNIAQGLNAIARGGFQFTLIIWLQGIWLPLHGYGYDRTPFWAAIYLIPLTVAFLIGSPLSGWLSDRFGPRLFAAGGLVLSALAFGSMMLLPTNFDYPWFAALIVVFGIGSGFFGSSNAAAVMTAVPASHRGAASGVRATFQNSGLVFSNDLFFSMMAIGLAGSLRSTLVRGLTANGIPDSTAHSVAQLPPGGVLFSTFLGFNPIHNLLGPSGALNATTSQQQATLTGPRFFSNLMAGPFHHGLIVAFSTAAVMSLIGAAASLVTGPAVTDDVDRLGLTSTSAPAELLPERH